MSKKALGRGLNALLRTVETTATGLEEIPLERIDPNPLQPRRGFPEETLKELAESIRASGVVQPVLLRRTEDRYQLVAGERRLRAARLAGLETIPAVIRELADREALELALTENILREDLNPLEVAGAYQALQEKYSLSHEEIAEHLGLNRSSVTNTLRLLRLPPAVQEMIANGDISAGHARALLGLDSASAQVNLAKRVVKRSLSVRQVEKLVGLAGPGATAQKAAGGDRQLDPNIRAAVLELERALGTRVKILGDGKRGKIEISYYSAEDLNRLYDLIVKTGAHE